MHNSGIRKSVLASGAISALAFGLAGNAAAAPVTSGAPAVRHSAPNEVTDVQYRYRRYYGYRRGAGIAAGIIGLAAGAALASPYYYGVPRPYYYAPPPPPPYYGYPAYYGGYGYYGPPVTYYGAPYGYYRSRYYGGYRYDDEYDRDRN